MLGSSVLSLGGYHMLRHVGASFRKLALRDQDLDHGVVDHLFGEVTRDTGEENIHTVERTRISQGINNKSNLENANYL